MIRFLKTLAGALRPDFWLDRRRERDRAVCAAALQGYVPSRAPAQWPAPSRRPKPNA